MKRLIILKTLLLMAVFSYAQTEYPVSYNMPDTVKTHPDSVFSVSVSFSAGDSWYIYAPTGNNAAQGMIETNIIFNLPKGIIRKGKMQLPESKFKGGFEVYDGKEIRFTQLFTVSKEVLPGVYMIKGKVNYQTCNEKVCLPPKTDELEIKVVVAAPSDGTEREKAAASLQFSALDGRKVDLAKLKGKLLLIDCWATWCRPCIAEFDNLKKLYGKYHSKGFEVIGMSMDAESAKQRVIDLVAQHKLPWPQGFEGKGFAENSFVKQYGIASLPAVFLIDKEGNIVDKDARGEKLEALILKYLE